MKVFTIAATVLMTVCLLAAGCNQKVTTNQRAACRTVQVDAFDEILVTSIVDVVYTQSQDPAKIEIIAPDQYVDKVLISVRNKVLSIGLVKNTKLDNSPRLAVKVSAPAIKRATTRSTGNITFTNPLKTSADIVLSSNSVGKIQCQDIDCGHLQLLAQSAGNIKTADINCKNLKVISNSTGNIIIEGGIKCCNLTAAANSCGQLRLMQVLSNADVQTMSNSAGNISIKQLTCNTLTTQANSSGNVTIKKIKSTTVSASSSSVGNINLSGTCKTAVYEANSTGHILCEDLIADAVTATSSSVGNVQCHARKSIYGRYSSLGNIDYSGNPSRVNITKK